jgi:hypothetical protein
MVGKVGQFARDTFGERDKGPLPSGLIEQIIGYAYLFYIVSMLL